MATENQTETPTKKKHGEGAKTRGPSEQEFMARVRRASKSEVGKRVKAWADKLGIDTDDPDAFDKAIDEIKAQREKGMGNDEKTQARLAELEKLAQANAAEVEKYKGLYNKAERDRKKEAQRRKDDQVQREIMDAARGAAFRDPEYGMHLFRQHVLSGGAHSDSPSAFFESIKAEPSKKHLFGEEVVSAGPGAQQTQAPAQTQTASPDTDGDDVHEGGDPKPPKPAKKSEGEYDAFGDKDKRSFNERTAAKYGFRPSM